MERQNAQANYQQMRNRISLLTIEEHRLRNKFDTLQEKYDKIIQNKSENE